MLVVGLGEIVWDLLPTGARLGGAPANVALHAAQLGDRAAIASRVGSDPLGDRALDALRRRGVDVSLVQRDPRRQTGTVRVRLDEVSGEPAFEIVPGAAWTAVAWDDAWAVLLRQAAAVCFGTLLQGAAPGAGRVLLDRVVAATRPDALRLVDLNLRPPFDTPEAIEVALSAATAVKLNEAETARLAAVAGVVDAARWLVAERGMRLVVETRGSRGSRLLSAAGEVELAAAPLPVDAAGDADPVGAGDAFTAALIHHLVRGHALDRAHLAASRYAAFVASRAGATPAVPDALRREICGMS